jgi:hypothetical protein
MRQESRVNHRSKAHRQRPNFLERCFKKTIHIAGRAIIFMVDMVSYVLLELVSLIIYLNVNLKAAQGILLSL